MHVIRSLIIQFIF